MQIPNACGTIALLHAAANSGVPLPSDSWMSTFFASSRGLTPAERAASLAGDPAIAVEHAESAADGQSDAVSDTWQHFVCFCEAGGQVWELDGRKKGPVCHGASSGDILKDAARVTAGFMARDPEELRFTLLALAPPLPEEDE